jgi:hypothetical protein
MARSSLAYIPGFSVKLRAGLSDTILKGTHPGTIPARFGLIWFSGCRGEDLNVIFNQNISNLYDRYKSVFKMAAVTKNRNFFNCSLLLYYQSK